MDSSIALLLMQDGIASGAIYALLAMALILVFSVTRVPLIPMGGFLIYAALSLNSIQEHKVPAVIGVDLILALGCVAADLYEARRRGSVRRLVLVRSGGLYVVPLLVLLAVLLVFVPRPLPMSAQAALAAALTVPLAPMMYRLAFKPVEDAGILIMFMVAMSIDTVMVGTALLLFGPNGIRTQPYTDLRIEAGPLGISGESVWIVATTVVLIVALYLFFHRTVNGKILRATAVNRIGAKLVGVSTTRAGLLAFTLAAAIASACGILIGPITTMTNSTGVVIGLKGFIAAVIGGFSSYPLAAIGAIGIGLLEAYSSFWASEWKDVIVFVLIIPILLFRSLKAPHADEVH